MKFRSQKIVRAESITRAMLSIPLFHFNGPFSRAALDFLTIS
jgi:hypothetical protein